jgi:hypothetical protein
MTRHARAQRGWGVGWLAPIVAVAMLGAAGMVPAAQAADGAHSFEVDGDEISGWWWLRDPDGVQHAEWTFQGTPVDDLVVQLYLLATDTVSGGPGVDARFWLSVGAVVDDARVGPYLGPELVTLPNVSPPDDPVGYTTRGEVRLDRATIPGEAVGIWVTIERRGPDGSVVTEHIAVNDASVVILGLEGGAGGTWPPDGGEPSGPPEGIPTIVALGDSFISGEAGRWAGNTNDSYTRVDALGTSAYHDRAGGESIPGCHRSRSAEVHIGDNPYGPDVETINLACSGATTETKVSGSTYKPGIDRCPNEAYCPDRVHKGQATMLEEIARTHNVELVVLSIGGNDFEFSATVEQCATDFMFSLYVDQDYCHDDGSVLARFSDFNVGQVRQRLELAYEGVIEAMTAAGYTADDWTFLVQTYPSPLAPGGDIRYRESGFVRHSQGGCPFWDEDADWANSDVMDLINGTIRDAVDAVGAPNMKILDVRTILVGHRLCEDTVDLVGSAHEVGRWTDTGACDGSEWVQQIRALFSEGGVFELPGSVYQKVESFHPNYWGQLALRNCLRQAYNNGDVRGGTCQFMQDGLNDRGEPQVILTETCTDCGV